MRVWVVGLSLVLGLSGPVRGGFDHSRFDRMLRAGVRGQLVDYALIQDRYLDDLDAYLGSIKGFDPSMLARDERLALYINLYNATMIREVIKRRAKNVGWNPSRQGFAVFQEPVVRVDGKWRSLNDLENVLIRPEFGEPRVHAALVCAAVSCPPLVGEAFTGVNLERLLEANMRRFVNDPTRNKIDVGERRMELSPIFQWYAEDFGGPAGVVAYIDGYHDADLSEFEVGYGAYSWELNGVK